MYICKCVNIYIYISIHMYENINIIKRRPSLWTKATPCFWRAATHCCSVLTCVAVCCIVCCSVWLLFSESPRPVSSLTFMYGFRIFFKLWKKIYICWKTRQHPVSSLIDSESFYWLLFHPHHTLVSHPSFNFIQKIQGICMSLSHISYLFHYLVYLMYFQSFWSHILFPVSFEHQVLCIWIFYLFQVLLLAFISSTP